MKKEELQTPFGCVLYPFLLTLIYFISPFSFLTSVWVSFLIISVPYLMFFFYCHKYFGSEGFLNIKDKIKKHAEECNDLNEHIRSLESSFVNIKTKDNGYGVIRDSSEFKYNRTEWSKANHSSKTYNCSASVCRNAKNHPIKYLCKYFDVNIDDKNLSLFEGVLNDFSAAFEGKKLLVNELELILDSIKGEVPELVFAFAKTKAP